MGLWRAMRKTTTSRDAAVGSDAHYQYDSGNSERRNIQPLTREASVAWSLHDANFSCAADRLGSQKYKLPWETGFAGTVLSNKFPRLLHIVGDEPMQVRRSDFILGAASSSTTVNHIALLPKLPGHVRCLKLMNWHTDPDDLKRKALGLDRIMVGSDLSANRVGKMMHDLAYNLSDENLIRQMLEDTFAKKSPATLYKRALCFWKYFNWMKGCYSESLHLSEDRIYRYVCTWGKQDQRQHLPKHLWSRSTSFHMCWALQLVMQTRSLAPGSRVSFMWCCWRSVHWIKQGF